MSCDSDGSGFCGMLQTTLPALRFVQLFVPGAMGAEGLATVMRTLCRHAPPLLFLALIGSGADETLSAIDLKLLSTLFPGFEPLRPLLVGEEGSASPGTLLELHIKGMGPVGRVQLLELAAMAEVKGTMPLQHLRLDGCVCSVDHREAECRRQANGTAVPYSIGPSYRACDCPEPESELESDGEEDFMSYLYYSSSDLEDEDADADVGVEADVVAHVDWDVEWMDLP